MEKKTLPLFGALCSVPFIMVLGNSMLIPILPILQRELGITQFEAGLIITAFSIPTGILIPLAGYLSDQWGRKAIMVPGIILYGLGGGLAGIFPLLIADPYYPILGSRILMGIGAAGTAQLAMAATSDLFTSRERIKALGYIEASNGIGKVSSPIIGSTTALLAYYAPFFIYPLFCLLSVIAVTIFIPPSKKEEREGLKEYFKGLAEVKKEKGRELALALLTALSSLTALFGILFYFSHIIEEVFRWQGLYRGLALSSPVLALSIVSILGGIYLKDKGLKTPIALGMILLAISLFLFSLFKTPIALLPITLILGGGLGLVLPGLNTLFTSAATAKKRGMITSIYASTRFFGTALGPLLFSLVFALPQLVFAIIIGLVVINTLLLWFFLDDERILPESLQ